MSEVTKFIGSLVTALLISLLIGGTLMAVTFDSGRTTATAGTRAQLSTTSVPCKRLSVTAFEANTDTVSVGGSDVVSASATRNGVTLFPGQTEPLDFGGGSNLTAVYLDTDVNDEGITWLCINN